MGKLNNIDKAAAGKGSGINTLWQFVKFIVVSLGAFVIQTVLPIIIQLFMSDAFINQKYEFFVFASAGGEGEKKRCQQHHGKDPLFHGNNLQIEHLFENRQRFSGFLRKFCRSDPNSQKLGFPTRGLYAI